MHSPESFIGYTHNSVMTEILKKVCKLGPSPSSVSLHREQSPASTIMIFQDWPKRQPSDICSKAEMDTFAETEIADYHLSFADIVKQTSIFHVYIFTQTYTYIYGQRQLPFVCSKQKQLTSVWWRQSPLIREPFSHRERKFVVCPFVDEETNGSYPFANWLNWLSRLDRQTDLPIYAKRYWLHSGKDTVDKLSRGLSQELRTLSVLPQASSHFAKCSRNNLELSLAGIEKPPKNRGLPHQYVQGKSFLNTYKEIKTLNKHKLDNW